MLIFFSFRIFILDDMDKSAQLLVISGFEANQEPIEVGLSKI